MTTVMISGWNVGFNKVKFTQLLQRSLGYRLAEAKRVTDAVMAGDPVQVKVIECNQEALIATMIELGAKCAVTMSVR